MTGPLAICVEVAIQKFELGVGWFFGGDDGRVGGSILTHQMHGSLFFFETNITSVSIFNLAHQNSLLPKLPKEFSGLREFYKLPFAVRSWNGK